MSEMNEEQEVIDEQQVKITFDDDEPVEEEVEEEVAEETEEAPAEPEKVTFSEEQQKIVDGIANRKTAQIYEERQKREEAERVAAEAAEKLQRLTQGQRPEVPPPPEPYDPEFQQKLAERDKAFQAAIDYDLRENILSEQRRQAAMQAEQAKMQAQQAAINEYTQRAATLNISPEELMVAGTAVQSTGIVGPVIEHILHDPIGPQITMHLSKNLAEIEKINQMTPTQAAVYIENTVKPAATQTQKKVNPPPAPAEHLSGRGQPEGRRGPKGARFE